MAARPSWTDGGNGWSSFFLPWASLTDIWGEVPIPSIWPRASTRQPAPADCWNTQNFRLDEPALSIRVFPSMTPPPRLGLSGEKLQAPRPHAVRPAVDNDVAAHQGRFMS